MMLRIVLLLVVFMSRSLLAIEPAAELTKASTHEISIEADDGFLLSANFHHAISEIQIQNNSSPNNRTVQGTSNSKGVLLLHQCNASKVMYANLVDKLSARGISSLALDFRGFGKSTTESISKKNLSKTIKNRKHLMKQLRRIQQHWSSDVEIAYRFLKEKIGSNNISLVGASCGGGQAVELSTKYRPTSIVLISSGLDKNHRTDFEQLLDIPMLIIAAQGDKKTFEISQRLFLRSENKYSRLVAYKGKEHGRTLFKLDSMLEDTLVDWIVRY